MKKIKIGVLGAYRGSTMIRYCRLADNAELVAICDKWEDALEKQKALNKGMNITYYNNFDDFIKHDMDAVVLANYANEHAPFAIKALKAGKHVYSEVVPVQTMQEAVELIETVEQTGKVYAFGENYCYMSGPMEMRKLYIEGKIGELEYAECEYFHNCESIWPGIAYGDPTHWRNNMFSTFYCTHSFGPIRHISGLRPVSVVGFETSLNERNDRIGAKGACFGIEMVTLENGAIVKSGHGGTYCNSIWYMVSGSKGRMETAREDADEKFKQNLETASAEEIHAFDRIYINADEYSGGYSTNKLETYLASDKLSGLAKEFGHGGSDFYPMNNFIEKIKGNEDSDTINVYEAVDMAMVGMFAYRSILNGGVPVSIPDLRLKSERDKWRNDTACTSPKVAGEQLLPTRRGGTPDFEDGIYDHQKKIFEQQLKDNTGYSGIMFSDTAKEEKK